jgi:hypothetical protein
MNMRNLTIPDFITRDNSLEIRKKLWDELNLLERDKLVSDIRNYIYELEYKMPNYAERSKKKLEKFTDKWQRFLAEIGKPIYIPQITSSSKEPSPAHLPLHSISSLEELFQQFGYSLSQRFPRIFHMRTENKIDPRFSRPMKSNNPEIQRLLDEIRSR